VWANERTYDDLVLESAAQHRPPGWSVSAFGALIKAHIGVESSFDPDAFNPETQLKSNDPSRGLGQMRYSTAQDLGFMGNPEDLYQPELNVELMAQLIQRNLAFARGGLEPAISAYNAGFGNPPNPGGRLRADGRTFINQTYVDSVKSAFSYFLGQMGSAAPLGSSPPLASGSVPAGGVGCLVLLLLASTMTFLVAWFSG
jgi:soluble lytic murein transglycosylase-like protein